MQTKLTLRMEEELIQKAKNFARKKGKSLSKMVSEYFSLITSDKSTDIDDLPPIVKSLHGSLSGMDLDENDYKEYIEKKYL